MRFAITVERNDSQEWVVTVEQIGETRKTLSERDIRQSGTQPEVFPQPRLKEIEELNAAESYYNLCAAKQTGVIADTFNRIISKTNLPGEVKVFGQYLFMVLIGSAAWKIIKTEANGEQIDLELSWSDSETELSRLPWETMHDGTAFLAADPQTTITRIVTGTYLRQNIYIKPRILFVIGTDINEKEVRPGAEFIGLMRRIEAQGLKLYFRLLQRATSQQIEDEIKNFQPDIVHFICHGSFDPEGFLEIRPDKLNDPGTKRLRASNLSDLLKYKKGSPPIVVLNVCHSAGQPPLVGAPPLAAELVRLGIPLVVGMGGRIADTACRLFTRRFYEAILGNAPLAAAVSHGRRAGIMHLDKTAENSIDWAYPTIFAAGDALSNIKIDNEWLKWQLQLERLAIRYRKLNEPALFGSRHDVLDAFQRLLNPPLDAVSPVTVLAVGVNAWEAHFQNPQYGKTRLLEELAAQAVFNNYVSCLVTFNSSDELPRTALDIGTHIMSANYYARDFFRLPTDVDFEIDQLEKALSQKPAKLAPAVQKILDMSIPHKEILAVRAALQIDLLALQNDVRKKIGDEQWKVLVLLDEVHRFDDGARQLVTGLLNEYGLGKAENFVPVIFTFSEVVPDNNSEYKPAINALKIDYLQKRPPHVDYLTMGAFRHPKDEWLVYQQFLLSKKLDVSNDSDLLTVYETLYEIVKGVPSEFNSPELKGAIKFGIGTKDFIEASDDALLEKYK